MTEKKQNLSDYDWQNVPKIKGVKIGIAVAQWNRNITFSMKDAAVEVLKAQGVETDHIVVREVPGSFELPAAAQMMLEADSNLDAVICIGCVIQGETKHFDFICDAVSNGIMRVGLDYNTPVIFGVLTTYNMEQALDRTGGNHGNKGVEAAVSCLQMLALERQLR
jgi:6,7-dimethyl-8-ribityllumazine synthase